jgi:hypothetical protein
LPGRLELSVAELAILAAVTDKVANDIEAIDRNEVKYRNQWAALERFGDVTMLRQFESKRDAATLDNINDLKAKLTPAGWAGLHSFINSVLMPGIHTVANPGPLKK